jgi:hypothetical protein
MLDGRANHCFCPVTLAEGGPLLLLYAFSSCARTMAALCRVDMTVGRRPGV